MSIFNFNKKNPIINKTNYVQTKVIYNTKDNLLILISLGTENLYEALEFLQAAPLCNLTCIISHNAKQKPITKEEQEEFKKTNIDFIDERYFILVSGYDYDYPKLYNHLSLSNKILQQLTLDFYNYCDTTVFKDILSYDTILEKDKFKYQKVLPLYDKYLTYHNPVNGKTCNHDDIIHIMSNIPEYFDSFNLAKVIYVYLKPGFYETKKSLESLAIQAIKEESKGIITNHVYIALSIMESMYKYIIYPPSLKALEVFTKPIFLRDDDIQNTFTGEMPIEKLDELFRQSYDRFNNPTIEVSGQYKDIDEYIKGNNDN